MRPSATESLYKELDVQEGAYEYSLPASLAIRPLRLADLDQVARLEETAFPENERATPEKLKYRLTVCPELCAGVFVREFNWKKTRAPAGSDDEEEDEEDDDVYGVAARKSTMVTEKLVGHIISTKTASVLVDDKSMEIGGHDESGRTIAIHSLAIDPEYRGRHVGYIMLKDYIQKFFGLCTADGMALLAHTNLVGFYTKHGFQDEGRSSSSFGGEHWEAMRLAFDTFDELDE